MQAKVQQHKKHSSTVVLYQTTSHLQYLSHVVTWTYGFGCDIYVWIWLSTAAAKHPSQQQIT